MLKAEKYGFDFALSMIKSQIKMFGSVATLVMPPVSVARMASTVAG